MKAGIAIVGAVAVAAVVGFGIYMIDVDQTQEARLPDVEVSATGGQMPEFDAEVGSISVDEEQVDVTVPKVKVVTEEETVTVPTLNVTTPEDESVAQND